MKPCLRKHGFKMLLSVKNIHEKKVCLKKNKPSVQRSKKDQVGRHLAESVSFATKQKKTSKVNAQLPGSYLRL